MEYGLCYLLLMFAVLIWALVYWRAERPAGDSARTAEGPQSVDGNIGRPDWRSLGRHVLLFLLSVPVAGLLSAMLVLLLMRLTGVSTLLQVTIAIFLLPLVWGAYSTWLCSGAALRRSLPLSLLLLAVGYSLLFLLP